MTESKEKLSAVLLLYGYAVALGGLYAFSFWRPFGFNAFPFFSLQDYLSFPLDRAVVIIAVPLLAAAGYLNPEEAQQRRINSSFFWLLFLGCSLSIVSDGFKSVNLYVNQEYKFRNELSVIVLILICSALAFIAAYRLERSQSTLINQIGAIALLQAAGVMAAGYADGKAMYAGAANVYFLENRALCENDGQRDWVLIASLSGSTIFMNTIDKRLCLTGEKNYRLVSRMRREGI